MVFIRSVSYFHPYTFFVPSTFCTNKFAWPSENNLWFVHFFCCYFCEVCGVFLMEVLLCVSQDMEHDCWRPGARAAPLYARLLLSRPQLQGKKVNTHHCCPFPFPGCSFIAASVLVSAEAMTGRMPCWSFSLSYLESEGVSNPGYSHVFALSHEHTAWFTLISPVTCSTFFQKCKAVLAKNTHIKCSRSRGHSSKMLINFENLTQPGHETEGRTFVVGTDFQKFTTVLFLAGVCADVARQLRGRCRKQEALLMGP